MSQTKAQLIDTLVASLLPASDSAVDIGSNAVRFANIYGDTLYGSGANLTGLNIVTDTSPQLGGDLDTNSHNISIDDNHRINFGDSSDLHLIHDGTNSYLQNITGVLYINNTSGTATNLIIKANNNIELQPANGETGVKAIANGAVELYYDNSKKFETTATGATITGASTGDGLEFLQTGNAYAAVIGNAARTSADLFLLSLEGKWNNNHTVAKISLETGDDTTNKDDGRIVFHTATSGGNNAERLRIEPGGNVQIPNDSVFLQIGASQDLDLHHNGTNSYIRNKTGDLHIRPLVAEEGIILKPNGAVELYHDNSKKLETTSTGSQTTGMHLIKGNSDIDNQFNPLLFLQDSTNTNIKAVFLLEDDYTTGRAALAINVGESGVTNDRDLMLQKAGGRVGIRCTPTTNFEVSGASKFNGSISLGDSNELRLGTGNDIQIYHNGSNSFITNSTGGLYIRSDLLGLEDKTNGHSYLGAQADGAVTLRYDNSVKFATTSTGATITGRLNMTEGIDIPDGGDNNTSLSIGSGNDLRLYHDGSGSYIKERGTGQLSILSNVINILNAAGNEYCARFVEDDRVELHYNGTKKFETTSTGITVSGTEHKFTSGTSGDCTLILEADTDNNDENDIPIIKFRQDGGLDLSAIGTGQTGTDSDNHLTLANSAANGGISFRTGTSNGYTNAVERMRILAGGGLTFNGDTSTNNALSDYEQGTWTATAEFNTGGFKSCSNNVCRYVKVGTLVHISGRFSLNNHTGASSGELRIEGLPFSKGNPSGDGNSDGISIYVEGAATNITNGISGLVLDNTTRFLIRRSGTTASGNDMAGKTDSGTTLLVGGTYSTFG